MEKKVKSIKSNHKSEHKKSKQTKLVSSLHKWYVLAPVIGIGAIVLMLGSFELYFWQRVMPGVYVDGMALSGKRANEVTSIMERLTEARVDSALVFTRDQQELLVLNNARALVAYDKQKTVDAAMKVGREGSYSAMWRERLRALRTGVRLLPAVAYDRDVVYRALDERLAKTEQKAVDAHFVLESGGVRTDGGTDGTEVEKDALIDELGHYWSFTRESNQFPVTYSHTQPKVTTEELQAYLPQVQTLLNRTLTISSRELYKEQFNVSGKDLFQLLSVEELEDGSVKLVFDDYKVAERFRELAEKLRRDPQDAQFQIEEGRVSLFQPSKDGTELDTQALAQQLLAAALDPNANASVEAPLKLTSPAISTASANEYGIREKIATGRSTFRGSAAGRIHNVALASQKLNGVLIPPGEVFSMYKTVGEIEKETGFKDAFIIKDGRTIPGVGGGVCQVSTTLFRAVLDAGLPIVERKAHAYRVYYYEQDSAPGIDAAVYFPSGDFKFKNDTGNYLLLETIVDTKKLTAEFNLYGVSDGRKVTMTKPIVGSQTPPPPDLYVDDPTLQRGKTVQDDHAAWGALVTFDRTVTKDGTTLYQDTFKSAYKAWQAVFRVGTKDN